MKEVRTRLKYPKFILLILTFVLAYLLFQGRNFSPFYNFLISLGYLGTFFSGFFIAYGFTAAPATVLLLILAKNQNIFWGGLAGGLGALIGDLLIFKFIKHCFADEIKKLSEEKIVNRIHRRTPKIIRRYLAPVFAGFFIASPLPDEIGVSLLAASTTISAKVFSVISYILHTAEIFIILLIGTLI